MTDADQLLALATRLNKAATEISKQVTEVHDVADELAAMAENGGVEPPDPEPPGEGAHPADPASWTVTNLVDATQHSLALPVELRGPGLVVASFSGEHATKLELGALDGFTGTDPAVLAGNTLRLYHRALAANERLNMLTLLVSPAESVLGWVGWFPDEDGEFATAAIGASAANASEIEIKLPEPPSRGAGNLGGRRQLGCGRRLGLPRHDRGPGRRAHRRRRPRPGGRDPRRRPCRRPRDALEAGDPGQPCDRCRAGVRRQGCGRARPGGAARARAGPRAGP